MLHSQIEIEEVVERYVRNRLAPEERQAFEEHFFGCEECFEKLQAAERFFAGLSDAAEAVLLSGGPDTATTSPGSVWSIWALAAATCASLVFAAATGWMYLVQAPKLRNQLDQAIAGSQLTVAESKANIVKPDEEHVIWPFNGEYWRDELGFYRQTITSKCGR